MKRRLTRLNSFWLILSLAIMLVSSIGAAIVQTSGGAVTIKNMSWETASGKTMSALLLIPDGASAKDKRPAIVLAHGWWNNKEMQDSNYVELARRGYVVLSIDMYGHASSSNLQEGHEMDAATGMYDAVKEIASLPYVDTANIGISGHSNGARAANWAVPLDDAAPTQLIKSVYLVDNDPIYVDAKGKYVNYYGNRDVGVQADQYDEFFFRSYTVSKAGVATEATPPRDYITTPNAQSFLNFGADPAAAEKRSSYTTYTQSVDGRDAIREVDNPAQTHPWGPFSKQQVTSVLTFFNKSLGTPNPIAPGSQIWQLKEFFNAIGLIGFAMFLIAFAKAMLGTRLFAGLKVTEPVTLGGRDRRGHVWFWGALAVSAVVSGVSYILVSQNSAIGAISFLGKPPLIPQGAVWIIGLWAAINGVASLIIMTISYLLFGRKTGVNLREIGVLPGWKKFGKSILLAIIVVGAAYAIVFLLGYLFNTDFRLWVLAIPTFTVDKLWDAFLVIGYFLIYFVFNSIAINSFNRFTIRGKEWGNTAALALFNAIAPIILVIAQYSHFFVTGDLISGFGGINSIWLFPVVVILPVAAILTRKIYRATNNPYIGGFIMAAVVTLISVSNTLTYTK
ncbi:alpha/beta fold hydrolase [soil metagenome]